MTRLQFIFFTIVFVISGCFGGAVSARFFVDTAYGNQRPNKLTASSFELVDKDGNIRGGLSFAQDGPVLFFNDKKNVVRAYIGMNDKGPLLVFRHDNNEPAMMISSDNEGKSTIGLYAGRNKARLFLSHLPDKGPSISLFDNESKVKVFVAVGNGNPSVTLLDQDKKPAIAMLNRKGEGSILGIWNSNNEPAVSLAVKGDQPGLFMYQQPRTGLLFNTAGGRPALALMNNGTPVWSATGDTPAAPEMPLTDDLLKELTR